MQLLSRTTFKAALFLTHILATSALVVRQESQSITHGLVPSLPIATPADSDTNRPVANILAPPQTSLNRRGDLKLTKNNPNDPSSSKDRDGSENKNMSDKERKQIQLAKQIEADKKAIGLNKIQLVHPNDNPKLPPRIDEHGHKLVFYKPHEMSTHNVGAIELRDDTLIILLGPDFTWILRLRADYVDGGHIKQVLAGLQGYVKTIKPFVSQYNPKTIRAVAFRKRWVTRISTNDASKIVGGMLLSDLFEKPNIPTLTLAEYKEDPGYVLVHMNGEHSTVHSGATLVDVPYKNQQ